MNNSISTFTSRQHAILRHVWSLNDEEKLLLDKYYLLKIKAETLAHKLDDYAETTRVAIRDHLKIGNWFLQIEWLNTGYLEVDSLAEHGYGNNWFIISARINYENGFSVALIRKATDRDNLDGIPTLE